MLGTATSAAPVLSKGLVLWGTLAAASLLLGAGAVMDLLGLSPEHRLVLSVFAAAALALLGFAKGLSGELATLYDAKSARAKRTLDELRTEIRRDMAQIKKPLLVAIDDLDRLEPNELRLVLQLVRSNSDVPNLVFLLLLDRDRARQILSRDHTAEEATGLLDKVVQTQLDVPAVPSSKIDAFVEEALLAPAALGRPWPPLAKEQQPEYDLTHAVTHVVSKYVADLRSATRLLNAVSFQSARLRHGGRLEVYPADLLLLETLRLYEPSVYGRLLDNQAFLTEQPFYLPNQKDDRKAKVEVLVDGAREERAARTALSLLFDPVADALGGGYRFGPLRADWQSAGRMQHPAHFGRYFTTHTPNHSLSFEDAATLSEAVRTGDPVGPLLEAHREAGRLVSALDVVSGAVTEAPPESVGSLLDAVLPLMEPVAAAEGGGGLRWDAGRMGAGTLIVDRALERLRSSSDRLEALRSRAPEHPHFSARLVTFSNKLVTSQDHPSDHGPRLLDHEDSEAFRRAIGEACRDRLLALTPQGIYEYARPLELYSRWRSWADERGARAWLRSEIEAHSPDRSAALLSMFAMTERVRADPPPTVGFDVETLRSTGVGEGGFVSPPTLYAAIRRAATTSLPRTDLTDWAVPFHVAAYTAFPDVESGKIPTP